MRKMRDKSQRMCNQCLDRYPEHMVKPLVQTRQQQVGFLITVCPICALAAFREINGDQEFEFPKDTEPRQMYEDAVAIRGRRREALERARERFGCNSANLPSG